MPKNAGDLISACRNMAIVGNAEKGRPKKRWNEAMKDNLKKCSLYIEVYRETGRDGRLKLWGKRPTCASTEKGRKTRSEMYMVDNTRPSYPLALSLPKKKSS